MNIIEVVKMIVDEHQARYVRQVLNVMAKTIDYEVANIIVVARPYMMQSGDTANPEMGHTCATLHIGVERISYFRDSDRSFYLVEPHRERREQP